MTQLTSDPRVRTFFQTDPVSFIDEVVASMSHYVSGGLESLSSMLSDRSLGVSPNHKAALVQNLNQKIQTSLTLNADIFEMYLLRNIFHIPVDVDLAGVIMDSHNEQSASFDGAAFGPDSEDLDQHLADLHHQIGEAQFRRKRLANSIQSTRLQLKISEQCLARLPALSQLRAAAAALPVNRVEKLREELVQLLERSRSLAQDADPVKSLAFHKGAFVFD
jgi:hypothetical protein